MKTYLVTGGAGFIGSNFIRFLLKEPQDIAIINVDKLTYAGNPENLSGLENDPRYKFIKADICDVEAMKELFSSHTIDYVVNFAAESHVDRSIENPDVFVSTNINGTVNLLNQAGAAWSTSGNYHPGVRFLQVSTDEVYGSLGAEGFFCEDTPLDPHSPYSASKAAADLMTGAYFDTYKLPVNITRCSNNYGPYQFPEKLIPLMINNALNRKELPVYGDGLQVRDWLYVDDHCRALNLVLTQSEAGQTYNIGGNNESTNIMIVKTIINYLGSKFDPDITEALIRHVTDRKGHDRRYAIDASKIKRDLGWTPQTVFASGITKTIEWYLSHKQWMENITNGQYKDYYQRMYEGK